MSYKEKPQIKLYAYSNDAFILQAIIDDYAECSFENNRFSAGQFSITINYNIPNALKFERGLWVQFGNNPYAFGEIINISDSIGEDGKGSQIRTIIGYDARYIFKRRIIKNLNNVENWAMTAKGEICMRNLIKDQCGSGAELKRQLPITNTIPDPAEAIGKVYSVAESFTNLYEVLSTIATQSEIGWRINFNGETLTLEFYSGEDRHLTVRFDTDYESLSNGEFTDSSDAFANTIYVGGKGQGADRDIYEGETVTDGLSPTGMNRFEAWDNQSNMTTENEYEAEALSMLNQYGQTLQVSGQGLAKCPYEYGEQYNVGDLITIAFSGKSAIVQILSVTEHWAWGAYDLEFSFGKPQPDLNKQLQLILKQIQRASNKTSSTDSVRWYTIPTDTQMPKADVVYTTIGFIGNCASGGSTFTLYLDNEKTGAKTYHVYFKQLGGGKLTLTTGKAGASNLVLNSGTYVAIIYVDENGNVTSQGATATSLIESGNTQPVTSGAVNTALGEKVNTRDIVDAVTSGDMHPVTSNAVAGALNGKFNTAFYTDVDLDTLTNFGIYQVRFSARTWGDLHFPIEAWGVLIVARPHPNGDWINQIFIPDYEPILYQRSFYASDMSIIRGWQKLLNNAVTSGTVTFNANVTGGRVQWCKSGNVATVDMELLELVQWTDGDRTISTSQLPIPLVENIHFTVPPLNGTSPSQIFEIDYNGYLRVNGGRTWQGQFLGGFTYLCKD